MATWDDILQVGTYGGVVFDFVSTRDEHSNTLDVQSFPNKPGQRVVARARNGVSFDVLAIFIEDDYPSTMNKLIEQLDDGGIPKELVHPVFGSIQAACDRFTVTHDIEDAADSATMQITFREHTEGTALTQATDTAAAHGNAVNSALTTALQALSAFQAATEIQNNATVLQITGAINAAQSLSDSFTADGDQLTALELQAQANGVLAQIDVPVEALADYDTTEQYELVEALLAVAAEISSFANDLINAQPPLTVFVVKADTNILSLIHDLYGSSDRADEVMALNSIADPSLIPAGFQYMAYAA